MSFASGIDGSGNGILGLYGMLSSELMQILEQDAIDPGSKPGYQACKTIYACHPLGARIIDRPLQLAMSQERKLEIPGAPEEELINAFQKEWGKIGGIGADNIIFRAKQLSCIYGVSTLYVNCVDKEGNPLKSSDALPFEKLWELDVYFNLYDPLNTAGSLVLNQDPYAVDFMHPKQVSLGGEVLSNSKTLVLMNEQPIWIEWTDSAFGFVGRSAYQRAFYPLKSFVVSMLADQMIQEKLGLIVWKTASPGSVVDMVARAFKGMQRNAIKGARTNNVLSIGIEEALEVFNMQNVDGAGKYARDNILKNIATASGRPAQLLNQETLAEGFGEGSEDAKQIAQYINGVRIEMGPAYQFMDRIVQRRAWNPLFFAEIQRKHPERYAGLDYEAAWQEWHDAWKPTWPNLLEEPDSEKFKAQQMKLESATKIAQAILGAGVDPETKGAVCDWLAGVANDEKEFYSTPLLIDPEAIATYKPEPIMGPNEDEGPHTQSPDPDAP